MPVRNEPYQPLSLASVQTKNKFINIHLLCMYGMYTANPIHFGQFHMFRAPAQALAEN